MDNTLGTYVSSSTEFEGIKRLNVFMFFEDVNMLLPVETFHDEATNTVYTITDRMGTYCLVDMELFFDNLNIAPSDDEIEEDYDIETQEFLDKPVFSSYNISELKIYTGYTEYKDNFDVVFVIDTRKNKTAEEFTFMKEQILDISRTILKNSPNARIYFFEQNTSLISDKHYKIYNNNDLSYFTNYVDIENLIKSLNMNKKNSAVLSDAIEGIINECDLSRETFVFSIFDQDNVVYRSSKSSDTTGSIDGRDILDIAIENNVDISVIAEIDDSKKYGYAHDMYKMSGGVLISDTTEYTSSVLNHIYGTDVSIETEDTSEYQIILSTGLQLVKLDDTVANIYELHKNMSPNQPDSDEDGLTDYEEINFNCELIKITNGLVELPTYGECINYKSEFTYVERGLYRFDDIVINDSNFLNYVSNNFNVLPIISDPTSEDGDEDTIPDIYDYEPLVFVNADELSKCWLYKNQFEKTYRYLYGDADYNNYSDADVCNHNLRLTFEEDDLGRTLSYYYCIEDTCSEEVYGEQVKFLSPESEDMLMCGNMGEYSDVKYVLLYQLESVYSYYMLSGDIKSAEAIYHVIDDYRRENEYDGFKYQYSVNGSYVSPVVYLFDSDDMDIHVDINVTHEDIMESEFKNTITSHTMSIGLSLMGLPNSTTLFDGSLYFGGGYIFSNLLTNDPYSYIHNNHSDNVIGTISSNIDMSSYSSFLFSKALESKNDTMSNMLGKAANGLAITSCVINAIIMSCELYSWYEYWNGNIYTQKITTSIQIFSETEDTKVIKISDLFYMRGSSLINSSFECYYIEGDRLVNPNNTNKYTVTNNVNYLLNKNNNIVGWEYE